MQALLEDLAQRRAQQLLDNHRRVREAATGSYQVTASLPVDVMGVFVPVPARADSYLDSGNSRHARARKRCAAGLSISGR